MAIHYLKLLAKHSPRGDIDLLLAKHYLKSHQWSLALCHIDNSIKKGSRFEPLIVDKIKQEIVLKLGLKAKPSCII